MFLEVLCGEAELHDRWVGDKAQARGGHAVCDVHGRVQGFAGGPGVPVGNHAQGREPGRGVRGRHGLNVVFPTASGSGWIIKSLLNKAVFSKNLVNNCTRTHLGLQLIFSLSSIFIWKF